jgi:hypothetical protein
MLHGIYPDPYLNCLSFHALLLDMIGVASSKADREIFLNPFASESVHMGFHLWLVL